MQHPLPAGYAAPPQGYRPRSSRTDRDGEPVIRYTDATGQSSRHPHRGRRQHRSTSRSRSRSRSRASSASLDEMLIEATTGDENGMPIPGRPPLPGQHLSPNAQMHSRRHRSLSAEREYLAVPPQHHAQATRSRHSHQSMSNSGIMPGAVPQGPGVPGSTMATGHHTIQTHIFAPPVTGAPVKKSECPRHSRSSHTDCN